jgi:hypothetical protein
MLNSAKWYGSCCCCNPGKPKKQLRRREERQWQQEALDEFEDFGSCSEIWLAYSVSS